MGKIYYIIGKSATGKDHIYEALLAQEDLGLIPLVMYTTRPMREGEQDGREYWFVDEGCLEAFRTAGKVIEERTYHTVQGPWHYFTADDGRVELPMGNYLAIGTLESYRGVCAHFGCDAVVPVYIEVDDYIRLLRTIEREHKQENPRYAEVCRRFLADDSDYAEEKIAAAGIRHRITNNGTFEDCLAEVLSYVKCDILGV